MEPLLEVRRAGGFVPFGWDFATVSDLTVYPDGRAIVHGPQIAVHPPPALPNLLVVRLDDAGLDALVTAVRDAGLTGGAVPDYGRPPVADVPTTFVTVRLDGRTLTHAAEALGFLDGAEVGTGDPGAGDAAPEDPAADGGPTPGLTAEHRAARAALADVITRAHDLVADAGEGEPYPIEAFAVLARPVPGTLPADADSPPTGDDLPVGETVPPLDDEELERPVLAWPLEIPLADADDCLAVRGANARTLRDSLARASSTLLLEQDGVRYDAAFRPLLPHQESCDDL